MTDFSPTSLTNVLLTGSATIEPPKPEPTVTELQNQIAKLTNEKNYFVKQVEEARKPEYQLRKVMARLLYDAKSMNDLDPSIDVKPMYDRLVELVENDESEVWTPERDFQVTVKLLVTIHGSVTARTEDEAREKVEEDLPELDLANEHAVDCASIYDVDLHDVDIE